MAEKSSLELDFPEPNYDHLDLSLQESDDNSNSCCKASSDDDLGKKKGGFIVSQYILGTLVVRIVAARDLEPVQQGGGLGQIFGGGNRSSRNSGGGGSANPYASVKFGNTTQRTSEVFDTLDPLWPRQETMFMDVSMPKSVLTQPITPESSMETSTAASASHPAGSAGGGTASLPTGTPVHQPPNAVLTVALFHAAEIGKAHKYPSKGGGKGGGGGYSGDSDDTFLGMASVDLTQLFTGLRRTFDEWLPLSGMVHSRGAVRVVCEYEPSDTAPRPGDYCRFSSFCHPTDLFPLVPGHRYQVAAVEGDDILLSYHTPEGWVCSFQAHRYMLICEERHFGAMEICQDELASLTERLAHSPMFHSVTETVERVAVEGLLTVGSDVVHNSISLFGRWLDGGLGTAINDVAHAANWDGRFNPNTVDSLGSPTPSLARAASDESAKMPAVSEEDDENSNDPYKLTALPNMPECPITGEPMLDPVVAADGHTYERNAIARWLQTSDKSPLTGGVLPHKELVPNYGLLNSLQEAASRGSDTEALEPLTTVAEAHEPLDTVSEVEPIATTAESEPSDAAQDDEIEPIASPDTQ